VRIYGGYLPLSGGTLSGSLTIVGNLVATNVQGTNNVNTTGGGAFFVTSRSALTSPADGSWRMSNNAQSGFTSLLFATGASTDIGTYVGSGDPEGAVTARVGSTFRRIDGGADTTLYVKESGTGNTGWAAI
jgi:hypothetical protein